MESNGKPWKLMEPDGTFWYVTECNTQVTQITTMVTSVTSLIYVTP